LGVLLERGPEYTHDFQQAMARRIAAQREAATKELAKMKDDLPAMIQRMVEAQMAEVGIGRVDAGSPRTPAGNPLAGEKDPGRLLSRGFDEVRKGRA